MVQSSGNLMRKAAGYMLASANATKRENMQTHRTVCLQKKQVKKQVKKPVKKPVKKRK